MAELPETVTQLAQQLKTQRLIQIFVGDETEPYLIQQKLLEDASDYFVKAIKNEHLGEGNIGVLRFPKDDEEVWKMLVYFIMRGSLPEMRVGEIDETTDVQDLLIDCWIMGDRYFLPNFQDLVMLRLMYIFSTCSVAWSTIRRGFKGTVTGCRLRKALANEVVDKVVGGDGEMRFPEREYAEGLDSIMMVSGAGMEVLAARDRHDENEHMQVEPLNRPTAEQGTEQEYHMVGGTWREYMVGKASPSRGSSAFLVTFPSAFPEE